MRTSEPKLAQDTPNGSASCRVMAAERTVDICDGRRASCYCLPKICASSPITRSIIERSGPLTFPAGGFAQCSDYPIVLDFIPSSTESGPRGASPVSGCSAHAVSAGDSRSSPAWLRRTASTRSPARIRRSTSSGPVWVRRVTGRVSPAWVRRSTRICHVRSHAYSPRSRLLRGRRGGSHGGRRFRGNRSSRR